MQLMLEVTGSEVKTNFTIPNDTRDIISTIYFIRNLPIRKSNKRS